MEEVLRTNDAVLLSYVEALLADAGIAAVVLDANMSVLEGSTSTRDPGGTQSVLSTASISAGPAKPWPGFRDDAS